MAFHSSAALESGGLVVGEDVKISSEIPMAKKVAAVAAGRSQAASTPSLKWLKHGLNSKAL